MLAAYSAIEPDPRQNLLTQVKIAPESSAALGENAE